MSPENQPKVHALALLAVCCLLGWRIRALNQENESLRRTIQNVTGQADLGHGITLSGEKPGSSKDVEGAAKDAGVDTDTVKRDAKSKGAELTGTNTTTFGPSGGTKTGLPSTTSTPVPPRVPPASSAAPTPPVTPVPAHPFERTVERLDLHETYAGLSKPVPLGFVEFQASKPEGPWSQTLFPRRYTVATVLSTQEDGSHDVYSRVGLDVNGETFTLPIAKGLWTETRPEPKLRWSSKLYLGPSFGVSILPSLATSSSASLQFSIASYGQTTTLPSFAFGLLGVGFDFSQKKPVFAITPAAWNVGEPMPWIDSLYLGPSLLVTPDGTFSVVGTIAAKL